MKNLFNTKELFRTKNLLLMISTAVFIITMGLMLFTILMCFWMFGLVDLDVPSDLLCIYHDKEWVAGKTLEQVEEKYGPHDCMFLGPVSECRVFYFQCIDEYFCVMVDSNGNVVGEAYYVDSFTKGERNPHGLTEREKIYRNGAIVGLTSFPLFFINLPLFIYLYCSYLTSDFHNKRVLKVPIPTEKQN